VIYALVGIFGVLVAILATIAVGMRRRRKPPRSCSAAIGWDADGHAVITRGELAPFVLAFHIGWDADGNAVITAARPERLRLPSDPDD
jgi:hypothetical protein